MNSQLAGFLWVAAASGFSALSTYLIKMSSHAGAELSLVKAGWLVAAMSSYVLGFGCYTFALQRLQISLAYPVMTAITMALVAIIGYLWLQEAMGATRLAGIALIGLGAFLLAR
jgi:small multidrug resistance pump